MKRNILFAILASSLLLSSCDKWLSATSTTTLPADELFNTPEGFYNSLTGIYILCATSSLYGGAYTCIDSDFCAYPYNNINTAAYADLQGHKYTSVRAKGMISTLWSRTYQAIANVNMLFRQLDERGDVLRSDDERNLFYGEVHALRAMLHFDVLRYWGLPEWDGENASKVTVPYCTEYTKEVVPQRSYVETVKMLEDDILAALEYLENDPITGWSSDEFESVCNTDGYWNNRVRHLNKYAVEMLAARFYMWKKDYPAAKSYTQDVLDNVLEKSVAQWSDVEEMLLPHSQIEEIDRIFSKEHIFGLDCQSLFATSMFFYTELNLSGIFIPAEFVSVTLFPSTDPVTGSVAGAEDVRGTALMLRASGGGYLNFKLYCTSTSAYPHSRIMPLMKLAECYYTLAECAINDGDDAAAIAYLNTVRHNRGIGDDLPSSSDASLELEKEYYREFVNEGQIFPFLKRTGKQSLYSNFTVDKDALVWPYPQSEIDYGRVQEL